MDQFLEIMLHWHNLALAVVVGGGMELLKSFWPSLPRKYWYRRFQRLIPLIVCSIVIWMPGMQPDLPGVPRVLIGLCVGMFTLTFYDMIKKVFFRRSHIEKRAHSMGTELRQHYKRRARDEDTK